jgi:hypothetical protein
VVASVSASVLASAQGSPSELVMDPASESALASAPASVRAWVSASVQESGLASVEEPLDQEWGRATAWPWGSNLSGQVLATAWPWGSSLSGQVLAWTLGLERDCRSASGGDRE